MATSRCSGCNRVFAGIVAFDAHRIGSFTQKQRRCLTPVEMSARGLTRNEKGWWMMKQEHDYTFAALTNKYQ